MENKRGAETSSETPEEYLGKQVARRRKELGMTQAELAERLGAHGLKMHQVTVAKLETAQRPIRVNEAVALSQILDMSIGVLIPNRHEFLVGLTDESRLSARLAATQSALEELEVEMEPHLARAEFATRNVRVFEREKDRLQNQVRILNLELAKAKMRADFAAEAHRQAREGDDRG